MSLKEIWEYEQEKDFPGLKVKVDGKWLSYKEAIEEIKKEEKEAKRKNPNRSIISLPSGLPFGLPSAVHL